MARRTIPLTITASLVALCGCASYRPQATAVRYAVDVRIDPASSSLEGDTILDFERIETGGRTGKTVVELTLHPELEL